MEHENVDEGVKNRVFGEFEEKGSIIGSSPFVVVHGDKCTWNRSLKAWNKEAVLATKM